MGEEEGRGRQRRWATAKADNSPRRNGKEGPRGRNGSEAGKFEKERSLG